MIGWSPRCYIPSFVEIGPPRPVPEENFLKVFTIYGRGGHIGHVTWTICTNFGSPFRRRLNIKFGFDWPSGFGGEDV